TYARPASAGGRCWHPSGRGRSCRAAWREPIPSHRGVLAAVPPSRAARNRPCDDEIRWCARTGGGRVTPVDTLELNEAAGALARLEEWLRDRGFFTPAGAGLVADLYLGYGLGSTIRRHTAP